MTVFPVSLRFTPSLQQLHLRELRGSDELSLASSGTLGAIQLLDRLMVRQANAPAEVSSARQIATADRDRIFAMLYQHLYGNRIDSSIECSACQSLFDMDFALDDLIRHLEGGGVTNVKQVGQGVYQMKQQGRFRLPTGEDECLLLSMPTAEAEQLLVERCWLEETTCSDRDSLQQAMQQLAPMIASDLEAHCPECQHVQPVHFDLQSFLLSSLLKERERLLWEVHCLAKTYHWSHRDILELPRTTRRSYIRLILSELDANSSTIT
ncbi:MAG: hypothetical protein AAFV25_01330 [Bacteroidota bacterium]